MKTRGYLKKEEVQLPAKKVTENGPVPIIECPEEIPCNPCRENCPAGAIEMERINGIPEVDYDKCSGCGICLEVCPGLAIFTVDRSPEEGAELTLPYEFPLPEVGETVSALNRRGETLTKVPVKAAKNKKESAGDTPSVTVHVPEEHVNEVRNIRRKDEQR